MLQFKSRMSELLESDPKNTNQIDFDSVHNHFVNTVK